MRHLTFTLFIIITLGLNNAHGQNYIWAKSIGDISDDMPISKIGIDSLQNLYFLIQFRGQGYFGQDTIVSTAYKNLLIKTDSLGIVKYAKEVTEVVTINDLKVDKQGNIYIGGSSGPSNQGLITLVKYKTNGVLEYVYQPLIVGGVVAFELDNQRNLIIGAQMGANDEYRKNIFLSKINNNNSVQYWQYNWRVQDGISLWSLKLDSHSNVIIAGTYSNSGTFTDNDSISPNITLNATQGILDVDAFFAKFSSNGKILSAKTIDKLYGTNHLAIDNQNNLYLAENNPYCWDQVCYTHTFYIYKFDSLFNLVFSKETLFGYSNNENISNIFADDNYIYITGTYDLFDLAFNESTANAAFYIYRYNISNGLEIDKFVEDDYGIILKDIIKSSGNQLYFVGAYRGNRNLQNINLSSKNGNIDVVYGKLNFNAITTGVNDSRLIESNITIYPNPIKDKVKISTGNEILSKVVISNNLGQVLAQNEINATNFDVNMSTFPAGIYTITLFLKDGFLISKRILKN